MKPTRRAGTRQDWDAFLADPPNWSLAIEKIRFGSPLEIQSAPSGGQLRASTSRFRSIFQVIVQILTVDLIREKAKWDTELAKQRAIEAALKNHERALELSKKIKDPAMRKEFSRNVAHSIGFLSGPERCS